MNQIVFKFNSGFGNRLCNLMNLFYIHQHFPNASIYINWVVNHHCNIQLNDILDLKKCSFILPYDKYKNIGSQSWASSSNTHDTKWDNLEEWRKHTNIVSVSFHLYSFVPPEYCRRVFDMLTFTDQIHNCVSSKINTYGCGKNIIHFRGGDLITLLSENESKSKVQSVMDKIEKLKREPNKIVHEYNQFTVNRQYNDMIESISDLIYLSKHNIVVGYCPYSHFSSWIFVLSSTFINNPNLYPIFNYKIIDIVTV
jgi:hypothetical protein